MIELQLLLTSTMNLAIVSIVLLSFVYSVVKLNQRLKNSRFSYRALLAALHIVICLSFIALLFQPSLNSDQPVSATLYINDIQKKPHELTSNEYIYVRLNKHSENSLLAQYREQLIYQPEQLLLKYPKLTHLKIIGDGLSASQLALFSKQQLSFSPGNITAGVVQPNWKQQIGVGEKMQLTASFQSPDSDIHKLQLFNPTQQLEDEVSVINGDNFVLRATPKLPGLHLYQLITLDKKSNQVSKQWIPIDVTESASVRILIIQSSPSFESKQIQNWAAEQGAEILIRTRLSKEKFMTRSTNLSESLQQLKPDSLLDNRTLALFDIVIIDGRELKSFDNDQQNILTKAINNGLGVIIRTDGSLNSKAKPLPILLSDFQLEPLLEDVRVDLKLHSQSSVEDIVANSLQLSTQPLFNTAKSKKQLSPLLITPQGHVVAARKFLGSGKVTVSIVKQSYQLRTSGQAAAYSRLWNHLITSTARAKDSKFIEISTDLGLTMQNRKTSLCIANYSAANNSANSAQLTAKNELDYATISQPSSSDKSTKKQLELYQTSINHYQVCGDFWPTKFGWYKAQFLGTERSFYVHSEESWIASQQFSSMKATQIREKFANPGLSKNHDDNQKIISDWIYWLLIILCSSIIWIERKFWSTH